MNHVEVLPGLMITNQLCAFLKGPGTVVVSDLHVGFEQVLEDSGLHLPRIQTETMRDSLLRIIDRYSPDSFVVLGDLKHEFSRNLAQEWSEARRLLAVMQERGKVVMVRGNHDNYLATIASKLGTEMVDELTLEGLHFAHGHLECRHRPLVMGHEHPSVRLFDSVGAFVKLPSFIHYEREGILVMPAFSPLASGTDFTSIASVETLSPNLRGADLRSAKAYACSEIGILPLGTLGGLAGARA